MRAGAHVGAPARTEAARADRPSIAAAGILLGVGFLVIQDLSAVVDAYRDN